MFQHPHYSAIRDVEDYKLFLDQANVVFVLLDAAGGAGQLAKPTSQ